MSADSIRVWIPAPMRSYSDGRETVEASAGNVRQLISELEKACPGIKSALMKEDALRADVAVAVDGQIAPLGLLQSLDGAKEVTFIPAIGGG